MRRHRAPTGLPVIAALLLLGVLVTLPAGPAHAHARLIASQPAAGATLDTAPDGIVLEFNEPVEAEFGQLQVSGPDGTRLDLEPPTSSGAVVEAPVSSPTLAGTHTVAYRVVSGDGHPVEGTFTFEVSEAAVGAVPTDPPAEPTPTATPTPAGDPTTEPTPTPTPAATPAPSPSPLDAEETAAKADEGGLPLVPLLVGGVLVVGVAGALLARRGEDDASAGG